MLKCLDNQLSKEKEVEPEFGGGKIILTSNLTFPDALESFVKKLHVLSFP